MKNLLRQTFFATWIAAVFFPLFLFLRFASSDRSNGWEYTLFMVGGVSLLAFVVLAFFNWRHDPKLVRSRGIAVGGSWVVGFILTFCVIAF